MRRISLPSRRARRPARLRVVALGAALAAQLLGVGPVAAGAPQAITFSLPAHGLVGGSVVLAGTASSGLPITHSSNSEDICTVEGTTLSLLDQGTCTVTASQSGDETYDAAPDVQASMFVKLAQTITFALPDSGFAGASLLLDGSATSGLPVAYASTAPTVCIVGGETLTLLAPGTCEVTASQPGNDEWTPAADVDSSMVVKLPPYTSPDGASLGRYAFNGTIRTLDIDQDTGITYVGGDFTQIGIRTGSIAVVDPPGSGSDQLVEGSPDVVSGPVLLFPDDDTGYFAVGAIGSINGDGVKRRGVTRLTTAGEVDATWQMQDPCSTGIEPRWDFGNRLVAPLEASSDGGGLSTVGLAFIDKTTGAMKFVGDGDGACASRVWPSIGPFGPAAACDGWYICTAHNSSLAHDPARDLLVTETFVLSQQTSSSTWRERRYLVAYDMAAGTRLWSRELENPVVPPNFPPQAQWSGQVMTMVGLDGAILVVGQFPFGQDTATMTTMLLVDAATGAVLQRWGADGQQDLGDPSEIVAPPSTCTPAHVAWTESISWGLVSIDAGTAVGYASPEVVGDERELAVCSYGISGSGANTTLVTDQLGTLLAQPDPGLRFGLPSTLHDGRYVVGGSGAFDLQTGNQVTSWDPSPSSVPLSVISVASSIVLGGDLVFVHGEPANHVAALDEELAPVNTFDSELADFFTEGDGIQQVRHIKLLDGHLLVAGDLKGGFGRAPVVALDPDSGELTWTNAEAAVTIGNALAVDESTGAFYLGMYRFESGDVLSRFVPSGGGFDVDDGFDHTIGAIGGDRYVSGLALIGTRLYIGGEFGSVDGQARQGLARLTNGTVDSWDPMPITELDLDPGDILEMQPFRFVELGSSVVVAGSFVRITPTTGGNTFTLSSVLVYDKTSGARVRPVGTNTAWFPDDDHWAMDMAVADDTLYVVFGGSGIGAFNTTTLNYLPSRSIRTQPGWGDNQVLAIGIRETGSVAAQGAAGGASVGVAAAAPPSLVMGGDLGQWSNVSAGNVIEMVPSDTLTVIRAGNGGGSITSQPSGIACGATCVRTFPIDSSVQLSAHPVSGAVFLGWSGACSGTGSCTVSITGPRSVTATFADKAKPVVGTPAASIRGGAKLSGTSLPLRVTWTASDAGGSGIKRYELARSKDGGASWTTLSASLTSAAFNVTAPSSGSVRFRARAVDKAGNVGSWVIGPVIKPRLVQQSSAAIGYVKTWTTISDSDCSGGSARYAKAAGASATYTFTGRAVGFITTTTSSRGQARFYVDGVLAATVDLRSSGTQHRVVGWQQRWSSSATRTIKVVVVGTSGRPRVDLDAFAILR
jgi:hypothetical protein